MAAASTRDDHLVLLQYFLGVPILRWVQHSSPGGRLYTLITEKHHFGFDSVRQIIRPKKFQAVIFGAGYRLHPVAPKIWDLVLEALFAIREDAT
jgi:hypothetical protein